MFAKAPVPGAVKTRLAAVLDARAAAELHERLVRQALATATAGGRAAVELWCTPDVDHPFFAACARDFGVRLRPQRGADLGERMAHAFDATREPLVVIGADCPALTPAHLDAAHRALATHEVVVAPAEDGGYVLIGLRAPAASIFQGIPWGSDAVLAATRTRSAAAGLRMAELPTLWDVDRPEDYARLAREGLLA